MLSSYLKVIKVRDLIVRFSSSFSWRTHTCGELRKHNVGQNVVLCGWIQYKRLNKFLILRDGYGITQVYVSDNLQSISNVEHLPLEAVLKITGQVRERPADQFNSNMATGEIEVEATDVQLLNSCKSKLPFNIHDHHKVKESLRLQYRYLDLRNSKLQENLRLRSKFVMKVREFLCNMHDFVDVETPTLFRRTPGGAQEFIVPSRFPRKFYVLTQSPQQFKQLLMVGAIDRYFQIARCYRDESTLQDRQPEFTQIDLEMSFVDANGIQTLIEGLLAYAWPKEKESIAIPFPRMTYQEAMKNYGTDKPDTRYEMLLKDITHMLKNQGVTMFDKTLASETNSIQSIVIPQGAKKLALLKPVLEQYREIAIKQYYLPGIVEIKLQSDLQWQSALKKLVPETVQAKLNEYLGLKTGDLVIITSGLTANVLKLLGKIRTEIAKTLQKNDGEFFDSTAKKFLWIVDFPLFVQNDVGGIESAHHPFTAPCVADVEHLFVDPLKVRGQHYDLVVNGQEIGGGSIRIHDSTLQRRILIDILKEDTSSLEHLLDALESGCPPHAGIALGLDRLVSILCDTSGIRDVIAFPKSLEGKDLMSGAPSQISQQDKFLYHIESKE